MNKCRGLGIVSIFEKEKSFVWMKDFSFFKNSNFFGKNYGSRSKKSENMR